MGIINDYVENQQEALTTDNYSEMDAAFFAQLSYFRFEQAGYTENAQISVKDYAEQIRNNPSVYKQNGKPLSADEVDFRRARFVFFCDRGRWKFCRNGAILFVRFNKCSIRYRSKRLVDGRANKRIQYD